jgi:alpha-L-arabinofuranosidase
VVTVDSHAGLALVPPTGLGVNDAIWDPELGSNETSGLLREIGVNTLRYPGGSYGDIYHWQDHTAPGGYVAPNTDFDTFMASARKVHAQPIIIANYGTGTATEAAGWVRYANRIKHYGVKYWEIGNETYGNGHYGANWEADQHADKSPAAYARAVVEYAAAMKAVDPSVKIGAVLTTPGYWPDALVGTGDDGPWNQVVLSIAGPSIDFVVVHWYPGGGSAAESLARLAQAADIGEMIRAQIALYAGAGSGRIGIALTEINIAQGVERQLPARWRRLRAAAQHAIRALSCASYAGRFRGAR